MGPSFCLNQTITRYRRHFSKEYLTKAFRPHPLALQTSVAEHEKLKSLGVVFTMEPTELANVTIAVFDDTCGNLIQIAQT